MNIFELTAVAAPVAGAIAGGMSVRSPNVGWVALGVCVGLAIGLVLYLVAIGLGGLLARVQDLDTPTKLSPLQWLASMTAVLLPAASPFAAWALSVFVIVRLLHL